MYGSIKEVIRELLQRQQVVRSSDVVSATGASRQAVYQHLRSMVKTGELQRFGEKRGTYYKLSDAQSPSLCDTSPRLNEENSVTLSKSLQGLEEHKVWEELLVQCPAIEALQTFVQHTLNYAVTELVNNAIDHSQGSYVEVRLHVSAEDIVLDVIDDGMGAFENLKQGLSLDSLFEAIQELSKGKRTTQKARHSGEGIFFTSKAADYFELESNGLCWEVDNIRNDHAIKNTHFHRGTRVFFKLNPKTATPLHELFSCYTEDLEFNRTRLVIKLFEIGVNFVSRSEAKRVLHGLEEFKHVVLDFSGVTSVGQGFADEVFRIWSGAHPQTKLSPVNMSEAVNFMVRRAQTHPSTPR